MSESKNVDPSMSATKVITLCGGGDHGCCPTITFLEAEVVLADDYGGTVRLTYEQFNELRATSR